MREEIIPEMIKNVSKIKGMKLGLEETADENDRNPDWEQAFEKSGLGDKIREMNELQMEGADIYMSTFAQLKSGPFFGQLHNWFYPFDQLHSSVANLFGPSTSGDNVVLNMVCNRASSATATSIRSASPWLSCRSRSATSCCTSSHRRN